MAGYQALGICLSAALALATAGFAGEAGPATDANIVTGLDISDSVTAAEAREQIAALAAAFRAPDFLAAIRRGRQGRIGAAVFVWHQGQVDIVPWTLIAGERDAERVAAALETRLAVDADAELRRSSAYYIGRLTDLSRAIDHAAALLAAAPVPGAVAYFRDQVVGGSGAFLIDGSGAAGVREVMRRKFLQDLMVVAPPPAVAVRPG